MSAGTPVVSVRGLQRVFSTRGLRSHRTIAVDDLSFEIREGESLGLVGESGSGKSTTARIVCGLDHASAGDVTVTGYELTARKRQPPRGFYDNVQMIFQDPYLSLNPRMTVSDSIGYGLRLRGVDRRAREKRVVESLARVGLPATVAHRYPHQLSTGQRQRVGIARATLVSPKVIVADEPVSSLDVSLQAQILNLLIDIQEELNVAYLFISHDLGAVGYLCDRVIVMQGGKSVEEGPADQILHRPETDYTRLLVAAAGLAEAERRAPDGPGLDTLPSGIAR